MVAPVSIQLDPGASSGRAFGGELEDVVGLGPLRDPVLVWSRPDLTPEYARGAFDDLGSAPFVTGVSMLLALAAAYAGSRSPSSALRSPSRD